MDSVTVSLPSGFTVSVPVQSGAKIRDVRLAAQLLLDCKEAALELIEGGQILQDEELADKHLPGPWQAILCYSRQELVRQARICNQEGRCEDMLSHMRAVAQRGDAMSLEECELLHAAVTGCIGRVRASLLALPVQSSAVEEWTALAAQIRQLSNDALSLLTEHVTPSAEGDRAKLFCARMTADLHRFLAEAAQDGEKPLAIAKASASYTKAMSETEMCLRTTDPVRLGLSLSMSKFFYEVGGDRARGIQISRSAFDEAVYLSDGCEKDFESIVPALQSIRSNLLTWREDAQTD